MNPTTTRPDPAWSTTLAALSDAARGDAAHAASWWQMYTVGGCAAANPTGAARRMLAGLDTGDPAVLDALPTPQAGSVAEAYEDAAHHRAPTWAQLTAPQRAQAINTYRTSYAQHLQHEVATRCRSVLHPPTHSPTT